MKVSTSVLCTIWAIVAVLSPVLGDIYGHNPRFSNNRLKDDGTNTANEARLFNSQNNPNGGYQWGPPMTFYAKSMLSIEWTSQHSCGSDNTQCQIIIQYICSEAKANATFLVRDGTTSNGNIFNTPNGDEATDDDGTLKFGMHENKAYYTACATRSRNKGLFIADQNRGDSALSTRQQNNDQNGYECTEERDYYPYWQPTPWRDVAILTSNHKDMCKYYQAESQNVKAKNYCEGAKTNNNLQPVMEQECKSSGGQWLSTPSWGLPKPDCGEAPWGRDNHLGNGPDGYFHRYNWTLPSIKEEACIGSDGGCSCALRIRYNISTDDTQNWGTGSLDSSVNGESSPLKEDPNVMVAGNNFTLDINTNQFSRAFEDRTHTFFIQPRPKGVSDKAKIYNLNVRGKRGNIVNCFPATEYDFVPNHLQATVGDYIHFQWTGAETNENGAGNGQGRGSTDRHNIVQIESAGKNFPILDDKWGKTKPLFDSMETRQWMSNIGQTDCPSYDQIKQLAADGDIDEDQVPNNCFVLNKAPTGYFNGGLYKMNQTGEFYYMSSRANQFSNRSQKGLISIKPVLTNWQIALIAVAAVAVVGAAATAGSVVYAKKNPHSSMARFIGKVPGLNKI